MGINHYTYNYERNTEKHYAFLQGIQKRPNLGLCITANVNHNGTILYMVVPTGLSNLIEQSGLPHCWLTQTECEQPNPFNRCDRRLSDALNLFKYEKDQPDFYGPNKTSSNVSNSITSSIQSRH